MTPLTKRRRRDVADGRNRRPSHRLLILGLVATIVAAVAIAPGADQPPHALASTFSSNGWTTEAVATPSSVAPGGRVTITVGATSTTTQTADIRLEVTDTATGETNERRWTPSVTAGVKKSLTARFNVPVDASAGTRFTMSLSAAGTTSRPQDAGWRTRQHLNLDAGSFSVVTSTPTTAAPTTTAAPSTTVAPTTTAAPTSTTTAPLPPAGSPDAAFFEDFTALGSEERFDIGIYHRDDTLIHHDQWPGDHASTGGDDHCSTPEQTRTVHRGERSTGFNAEWIYRCAPDGDQTKGHLMTSIGDTSGYSIGAFVPKQTFTGVKEVRWDINLTDLGTRKFPEVKIVPADRFDFQNLPCSIEWLPCDTTTHQQLGSVGTSFFNSEVHIHNGSNDDYAWQGSWGGDWLNKGDPAVDSVTIRRTHFFRDNGNGTLTFGIEQANGTFFEYSRPGRFPSGPVRVVFADHNYTPTKDNPGITFTWHWDNIGVYTTP